MPVYNTPLSFDPNRNRMKGFEAPGADARNRHDIKESWNWTVGPMPVVDFIHYFLRPYDKSCDKTAMLSSTNAFASVPLRGDSPLEIYMPLLAALNKSTTYKSRCPGFVFDNASARSPYPHQLGHMRPHICLYRPENLDEVRQSDPLSRTELGYAELFIEVAADPCLDPFVDPPVNATDEARMSHDFVRGPDATTARGADRAFGQQIAYATEILARQCRVCVFSIALYGSRARFVKWDREGCVMSESFDIRSKPEVLCEFLWRFSQIPDAGRGHDPTVQPASAEEEVVFHEAVKDHVRSQLSLEGAELDYAVSEHYQLGHVVAIHVLSQGEVANGNTIRRYLVSRPVIVPLLLVGRGTKGFWAVDVLTGRVVFLKDTWRVRGIEGGTLLRMNQHGVRNIPIVGQHGDVPDFIPEEERQFQLSEFQVTTTDEFQKRPWACKVRGKRPVIRKRVHYRLVLQTVGYGLKSFRGSEELLYAAHDVLQAITDAYWKDSRLHRDISLNNIILVKEAGCNRRKGFLIDWDASCPVDDSGASLLVGRAGTWEFMSSAMLDPHGPERQQTIEDDMESVFYVVLYCCFLWLPHSLHKSMLEQTITDLFEYRARVGPEGHGGIGKMANAYNRIYTASVYFPPAIGEWINCTNKLLWPGRLATDHRPRPSAGEHKLAPMPDRSGVVNTWTLEKLAEAWSEFLKTHTLDRDDRCTHDHPRSTGEYYQDDVTIHSHLSYGCVVPHRRADDLSEADSRVFSIVAPSARSPQPLLPLSPPPQPPPPVGPRRSLRIRDQVKKAELPITPLTGEATRPGPTSRRPARSSRTSRK